MGGDPGGGFPRPENLRPAVHMVNTQTCGHLWTPVSRGGCELVRISAAHSGPAASQRWCKCFQCDKASPLMRLRSLDGSWTRVRRDRAAGLLATDCDRPPRWRGRERARKPVIGRVRAILSRLYISGAKGATA